MPFCFVLFFPQFSCELYCLLPAELLKRRKKERRKMSSRRNEVAMHLYFTFSPSFFWPRLSIVPFDIYGRYMRARGTKGASLPQTILPYQSDKCKQTQVIAQKSCKNRSQVLRRAIASQLIRRQTHKRTNPIDWKQQQQQQQISPGSIE